MTHFTREQIRSEMKNYRYRYPSDILWVNPDGWKYVSATCPKDAIHGKNYIGLKNIQVKTNERWQWVTEVSQRFGGCLS